MWVVYAAPIVPGDLFVVADWYTTELDTASWYANARKETLLPHHRATTAPEECRVWEVWVQIQRQSDIWWVITFNQVIVWQKGLTTNDVCFMNETNKGGTSFPPRSSRHFNCSFELMISSTMEGERPVIVTGTKSMSESCLVSFSWYHTVFFCLVVGTRILTARERCDWLGQA